MPILTTLGAACAKAWGFTSGLVKDQYFNLVSLLLPGNGTNGAQNNTFLDSGTANSGSGFTITRNGNTTQGTFSPFSQTGWGNYFDGTANGSLRADATTDTNLSGDFTIQAWVYPTANGQSNNSEIIGRGAAAVSNGWHFALVASTTQLYFGVNYATLGNTSTSTQTSTNIPLNQWTHVAVTRSGNTCRIYINGVVDTTNTGFTGTPTVSGTEYVYVGRGSYDSTNRQFTGYINNASIIKGTALTTFSQTQPLATGTSGQALLTCTANRFIDTNTATTAKTLTAGSGASVVAFSPFAPTAAYTTAAVGGSGYFDGTGDYLSIANNAAFNFGSGAFTIELWYYPITLSGTQCFVTNYGGGTTGFTVQMGGSVAGSGKIDANFSGDGSDIVSTNTVQLNSWNHIAVSGTPGATGIKLFINGKQEGSTYTGATSLDTSATLFIGQVASTNLLSGYLSGLRLLKGTALYTGDFTPPTAPPTAITNTSLLLNFTNAGITDATAKNDLETVGNAQISTSVSKFPGGSMSFNGTTDYLKSPASTAFNCGTGNWTIEAWVYISSYSTNFPIIIGNNNGTFSAGALGFTAQNAGNNKFSLAAYDINPSAATLVASVTNSPGVWYYVALVRNGTSLTMYRDGTSVASTTISASVTFDWGKSGLLVAGASWDGAASYFNGYIDDLRLTKYARYTSNFTAPTAPFPVQ